jgi:hypothetical protein
MTQKSLPKDFLKCYQLPNAEKSWYTCMFEDPSVVIITQRLFLWFNQVIQKDELTIFSIKSMIVIIMIAAEWYFFVKILAILCYFCSTYAYSCCSCSICAYSLWFLLYLCFFLYKIFNIWKITNLFVKQYKKNKLARPDLEPVEFLSTGLDRTVWLSQPDRIGPLKFLT